MTHGETPRRGRLKVFLGYAAGVGKTFRMLEEAHELRRQGGDVVIGYFEPHGRTDTIAEAAGLEAVPRRKIEYRGVMFEEMDADAVLARKAAVCLVDELAHTNVPGSRNAKRWEDVLELLEAGIDVWTTVNVQHIESLNDQVRQITGVSVRETLPDWVIQQADEVVMVDATPMALLNRLRRGVVYPPEKAQRALENFFKESTLVALRELALRQTAHEVEVRHEAPVRSALERRTPGSAAQSPAETEQERMLIHITAEPTSAMLIRRGRRIADFLRADCFAVHVSRRADLTHLGAQQRQAIEQYLNFARNLHIETRLLEADDPVHALLDFARRNRITQLYLARPRQRTWRDLLGRDLISRIVRMGRDLRVAIVAERRRRQ
jgi:two-component system sensor histidine kinase KdpD